MVQALINVVFILSEWYSNQSGPFSGSFSINQPLRWLFHIRNVTKMFCKKALVFFLITDRPLFIKQAFSFVSAL